MTFGRPLVLGDVVVNTHVSGEVKQLYVLVGWTARGKSEWYRIGKGTLMTAWWRDGLSLPSRYRLATYAERALMGHR